MKELVVARGGKRRAGSRAEKVPRPDTCGTKNPLRYLTKTHQSVPSCPSPYREKSKCLYERGWARLQWARVVVFGEGGVVAHQQHRVALITSSYRLGQRCGQTCCPRSADKTTAKRTKRADEERTNRWFLVFFFFVAGHRVSRAHRHDAVTARRTAAAAGGSLLQRRPDGGWGKRL